MSIRRSINKARTKFYTFITNYTFVKKISIFAIIVFLSLLVIGVIIAATLGPGGYTIWTHMISDLGGNKHTPVPILYDIACVTQEF
ncbi:MAG: hypothetical protein ACW990_15555 [Promethearchaeota archaeon]|jgi:hypothetical membrane protein